MIFSEHTYSVLIVSISEKFNQSLRNILPVNRFWPIDFSSNAAEARRRVLSGNYDIIIINTPLQEEFGTKLASELSVESQCGILILTPADSYDDVCYKTIDLGILTISKPVTAAALLQALNLTTGTANRMANMMKKQLSVEEKIDEMRIINHAKWLLIEHENMTEPEAHKFIEKSSMDKRITKLKYAEELIKKYES